MKRTMYQAARHTPKRGVGGSNPLVDASKQRCKPLFSRVCSFFCYAANLRRNHLPIVEGECIVYMRYSEFLANRKRTKMEGLLRKIGFLLI